MFEKLIGVGYVREMILAGASEAEIRVRWAETCGASGSCAGVTCFTNNLTTAPDDSGAVVR